LKRKFTSYLIDDFNFFKNQLLNFGKKFSNFCFLDNHEYEFDKSYECLAAFGSLSSITASKGCSLIQIDDFIKKSKDWIFGHISYDLKNEIENLSSENLDGIEFPDFQFFVPEIVIILSKKSIKIGLPTESNATNIFRELRTTIHKSNNFSKPELISRFSKNDYLETVKKLQQHILKGDCYEICFCQEFYADSVQIDPVASFKKLSLLSPNPFSAFYRSGEKYLLCASPERFLKKSGKVIMSQPIKGTSRRSAYEKRNDQEEINLLLSDEKERSENIMVVDLVRNDLSKICKKGSVSVKEYLKIYSFPHVHQMISTIAGELRNDVTFTDILSATFPMGSMTGVPKKKVMELIEQFEKTKRGLFSGSVGYIDPEGDFDFNVVIRSILYNEMKQYLSIQAGSAITWKSDPEKEYEECNLKIAAMRSALE
jgi:para-aminobenzoate synthetase component 1